MEDDECTQPCNSSNSFSESDVAMEEITDSNLIATQIVMDPRRLGQANSGFSNEDMADIFCILHPISNAAVHAAAVARQTNPKNTIGVDTEVKIHERNSAPDTTGTISLATQGLVACDLALRFSAEPKDISNGFFFGRNPQRCDFILGSEDLVRRVSNVHFRIYLNEVGVLMLEDQSTNGTAVNGHLLRAKDKENGQTHRHSLDHGSLIVLAVTESDADLRFVVRIPHRTEEMDGLFEENFQNFMKRVQRHRLDKMARNPLVKGKALDLFPVTSASSPSSLGRSKEWRGGNKYNKISTIGRGAFAVVYMITDKLDGQPYAAKELEKRRFIKNGLLDQKIDTEMKIMRSIDHPNIVRFVEYIDWKDYIYIIMEYVPAGDLTTLVSKRGLLPESTVKAMAGQLVSALKYLHRNGITHRDVKPDNILIQNLDPFHAKLTDFGLSKMISNEETFLHTFCGTLLYCAPEVYSEYREFDHAGVRHRRADRHLLPPQRYGHAVDIWSTAGVLFFALCGSPPYPVKNNTSYNDLLNHIMSHPLDIRPLQKASVSENGIRFVRSMLHTRPEHRATLEQLEQSSWLRRAGNVFVSEYATGGIDQCDTEVDEDAMNVDENTDPCLAQSASQLSIAGRHENGDGTDEDYDDFNDIADLQELVVPSSLNPVEGAAANDESFVFMRPPVPNKAGNGRLFGEVNFSAIGSSGAIPADLLNLPTQHSILSTSSNKSRQMESTQLPKAKRARLEERSDLSITANSTKLPPLSGDKTIRSAMPSSLLPQASVITVPTIAHDQRNGNSSSLMGAESLVGHLCVRSPVDTPPPVLTDERPTTPRSIELSAISRSKRPASFEWYATAPDIDGLCWVPDDLPPKVRSTSLRAADMLLPKTIFWGEYAGSHRHYDYPAINHSDWKRLRDYAEARGEKFQMDNEIFDSIIQKYRDDRKIRNPALEPDIVDRMMHMDDFEEVRKRYLARDQQNAKETDSNDRLLSTAATQGSAFSRVTGALSPAATMSPVGSPKSILTPEADAGIDFQPPKRILAKLLATSDSCLPTITINITDVVISWGRNLGNTLLFNHPEETRVSNYNFKIFLYKPGFYTRPNTTVPIHHSQPWKNIDNSDQDLAFYISTKASAGIVVNGKTWVPSHDKQNAFTVSKYWGELRNGDILTFFDNHNETRRHFVKFKFECYWGASKEQRKSGETFELIQDAETVDELDKFCIQAEHEFFVEKHTREKEEKKNDKEAKKILQEKTHDARRQMK